MLSKKTLVVLSGGMDSTTLLYHLLDAGHLVQALGVDYGQRHRRELDHASSVCRRVRVPFDLIDLSSLGAVLTGSALTDTTVEVPQGHYTAETMKDTVVPNRNMILLSVALARCVSLQYDAVAYAAHSGDYAIYADCREAFANALDSAARLCDFSEPRILRPFVSLTKADIAARGAELGVPFELTWSCYQGGKVHCGKCGTCVERIEAFHLAGVPDPTNYAVSRETVLAALPGKRA